MKRVTGLTSRQLATVVVAFAIVALLMPIGARAAGQLVTIASPDEARQADVDSKGHLLVSGGTEPFSSWIVDGGDGLPAQVSTKGRLQTDAIVGNSRTQPLYVANGGPGPWSVTNSRTSPLYVLELTDQRPFAANRAMTIGQSGSGGVDFPTVPANARLHITYISGVALHTNPADFEAHLYIPDLGPPSPAMHLAGVRCFGGDTCLSERVEFDVDEGDYLHARVAGERGQLVNLTIVGYLVPT